jgi:hypothetical protein
MSQEESRGVRRCQKDSQRVGRGIQKVVKDKVILGGVRSATDCD